MNRDGVIPIIFDLDGTLIDSLGSVTKATNATLAELGLGPIPEAQVRGYVGLGEKVFVERLIADTGLNASDYPRYESLFMQHYARASDVTPLFPKVEEVLEGFAARGVQLGLCTNKPGGPLAHVLEGLGWQRRFDCVVAGDTLPVRKPDPAPLLHVLEALGAERCVFVGDSPYDAEAAQRAGVPFALFTEGIRTIEIEAIPHDAAFSDFADLPGIYDQLTG